MITPAELTPARPPTGLRRKTILVVDDDDAIRRGLRRILSRQGYDVIDARDGHEAIQMFQEHPCDLALLDVNMPVLNGWGTIAGLRSLNGALPAIFLTARADHRNLAREAGLELMEKPVDLPLLLSQIHAVLSRSPAQPPQRKADEGRGTVAAQGEDGSENFRPWGEASVPPAKT